MSIRIQYQGQENAERCEADALDASRPVETFAFDAPVTTGAADDDDDADQQEEELQMVEDFLRRVPALNCLEIGIQRLDDDDDNNAYPGFSLYKALIMQMTARFWNAFLENHEAPTQLRKIDTLLPITPELLSRILQRCPRLEEMVIRIHDSHYTNRQQNQRHMWFWQRLWQRLQEAWTSYQLVQRLQTLEALKRIELDTTEFHFTELLLTGIQSLSLENLHIHLLGRIDNEHMTTMAQVLSRTRTRCLFLDHPPNRHGMDVTPVIFALRENAFLEELVLQNVSLHVNEDTAAPPNSSSGLDNGNGFNTTLRTLDISRVRFVGLMPPADKSADHSIDARESNVLSVFCGLHNLEAGVEVIPYLSHFPVLQKLALVPNPTGASSGHEGRARLPSLLSKTKANQLSYCQLSQVLQNNTNLVELVVATRIADDEWMQKLCQGLHKNVTLQRLQIPCLTLAHVAMLDEALRHNQGLQTIQIWLPKAEDDSAVAVLSSFFQGMAHWKRVETLDLGFYSTKHPTLLTATVDGLQHNDVLQQLSFLTPETNYASRIQFYLSWNQCGRRLLRQEHNVHIPMGLWAHILAHAAVQSDPSILFSFLQGKQDLWSYHYH